MNYNSIPRRFNKPTSSINHQYIDATLKDKQNTIDQNYGIMTQSVEAVLGQDLIREEDRQYLKNKVSDVLNTLGNTDSIKFDSKKARFSIQEALSSAAKDPNVLKQVANTRKIRQIQQFQQERSKKGNLNMTNFNDAWIQSGVDDYLKGVDSKGNKVDDIGSFNYLEYKDVQSDLMEKVKDRKELYPDKEVQIKDGNGDIITKTYSALSQAEWQQVIPNLLDETDRAQLAINGRVRFGYNNDKAILALNEERDYYLQPNNKKIEQLQTEMELGTDDVTKQKIKNDISILTKNNVEIKNRYDKILNRTGTAGSIGGYMLENQMVNELSSKLGFGSYVNNIKSDASYWKAKKEAEDHFGLGSTGLPDSNKDGIVDATTVAIPTALEDSIGERDLYKNEIALNESIVASTANQIYNGIKDEKTRIAVDNFKKNLISQGLDEASALKQTVVHFSKADNPIMSLKQKEIILTALDKNTGIYNKLVTASKKTENDIINQNSEKIFEQLYEDNPYIQMIGYGDSFKKFMEEKGINTKDKLTSFLNSDTKESNLFKANLTGQMLDLGIVGDSTYSNDWTNMDDYKIRNLNRISNLLGENLGETLVYTEEEKNGQLIQKPLSEVKPGERISFRGGSEFKIQPPSKIESFLTEASILKRKGFRDHSVATDGDLSGIFSQENYEKAYRRNLNTQMANISGTNMINIQGGSNMAKELALVANGNIEGKDKISLVKISPTEYQIVESGYTTEYDTGSDEKGKKYAKLGTVRVSDIENIKGKSDLRNFINFKEEESNIDLNINKNVSSGPLSFPSSSVQNEKNLIDYFGQNNPNRFKASKNYVENVIEKNPKLKGDFSNFAKRVIANSNKFETKFENIDGYTMVSVYMQGIDEPIYKANTQDSNISSNAYKIITVAPQIYLNLAIDNMALRYQAGEVDRINNIEKLLE